jgi:NADPH:quinone reductase-like Zn-dependent oxidoreductase/acyl carrier protein
MAAVQVARAAGARIFATAGTPEKRQTLLDLGCELVMDSRALTFSDEIRHHTNGRGVDVILNSLAGEALLKGVSILAPYGRFLEIGKRDLFGNSRLGLWPLRLNASFHAIDLGAVLQGKPSLAELLFKDVRSAFQAGMLHPLPYTSWPASKVSDAFRTMSQGKHIGKLVIDMCDSELQITSSDVPRISFREDATYVVTGGAGGFGLETAKWIVRRGGRHVVLLSRRSPETESVREAMAELLSLGARPIALSCDVTDRRQVHEILHQRLMASPPIRGVFHAAMVMDDALVLNLDDGRVQAVLRPKALGAWNLHEEMRGLPIDHFVLFSSISASIGNPGQASYAAANSILEGLAEYRRSIGLPATAVGWGFVSDTGFAVQHVELMKRAEQHGFHGVRSSDYLDMLERLLPRDCETVIVGKFDWEAVAGSFHKGRPASGLLTSLVGEFSSGHSGSVVGSRIREALENSTDEQRSVLLRAYLQAQVARTLRVPPEKVDVERPIVDLGLDSLMGIELATIIEQDCAITLPSLATSREITVNRLVRDILQHMGYTNHHESSATKQVSMETAAPCRLTHPV